MAIESRKFTPVQKEISTLTLFAAKNVSVEDFLRLRVPFVEAGEASQTIDAIAAVRMEWLSRGSDYRIMDSNTPSLNPVVVASRLILTQVPLPEYLMARHQGLKEEITEIINQRDYWTDDTGVNSIKVEKIIERLNNFTNDRDFIKKVAGAVGIKLDADFSK